MPHCPCGHGTASLGVSPPLSIWFYLLSSVVLYTGLAVHDLPGTFLSLSPIWSKEPWDYRLVLPVHVYIGSGDSNLQPRLVCQVLPGTLFSDSDLIVLPQHPEPHRSELVFLVIEFQPPVRNSGSWLGNGRPF